MARRFPVNTHNLKSIDKLEAGKVWVLKNQPEEAFFTIGKIAIDWDGDPMAYGNKRKYPSIKPHDRLGNAGHGSTWWGVVTNSHGIPLEQDGKGADQPYKNYMISSTKLFNNRYKEADIRRWTDATKIPYVALPNSRHSIKNMNLKPGCYCVLVNLQTMKFCYGIYADSKAKKAKMGEISKCAADLLGNKFGSILILVFPKSGKGQGVIPTIGEIDAKAREELKKYSLNDPSDHFIKAFSRLGNLPARLIQAGYQSNTIFADVEK